MNNNEFRSAFWTGFDGMKSLMLNREYLDACVQQFVFLSPKEQAQLVMAQVIIQEDTYSLNPLRMISAQVSSAKLGFRFMQLAVKAASQGKPLFKSSDRPLQMVMKHIEDRSPSVHYESSQQP
jgi:hypothetical protein